MSKKVKREIFLEDLPRKIKDKTSMGKLIDWVGSIGYKVKFIYEGIYGEVKIIDYNVSEGYLYIEYLDKTYKMSPANFRSCQFGKILGIFTKDFKIEVGQAFKGDKKDIVITKREHRPKTTKQGNTLHEKYYKYTCNICGWAEGWILERELTRGDGCVCCSSHKAILGINTIWDTDKWMVDLGVQEEDSKKYTKRSNQKIVVVCPDCAREKRMSINDIYGNHSISCTCSDKNPYPEKCLSGILKQLNVEFNTQLNKSIFKWIGVYKYDFYIPSLNIIIETHGMQHYTDSSGVFIKTLEEEQENDKSKKELALANKIKEDCYIIIDCRYSKLEFIKNSVLNSNLANLFDLSTLDWNKVQEFALSNLVKVACEYWDSRKYSIKDISEIMKLNVETIRRYLKQGNGIWCHYDAKEEASKLNGKRSKRVKILKDGIILAEFLSGYDLERKSDETFGVKLSAKRVSDVCLGKQKTHKGYTFQYITPTDK